jgi:UDP-glucuronate 4-epimerase
VTATEADISDLNHDVGFTPSTTVAVGIPRFVSWFRQYHRL